MATKRENLLRTLRNEPADYIPIVVACDPYNQPSREGMPAKLAEQLGEVRWKDNSPVTLARWLDLEVSVRSAPPIRGRSTRSRQRQERVGDEHHIIITTPSGEIREVRRQGHAGAADYAVKRFVETEADLKVFAEFMADQTFEIVLAEVATVSERLRFVGNDGMLAISMPGTPLGMMVRVYSGVEALAYFCADCPDTLASTLEIVSDNYLRQLRLLADVPADAVWSVDDTSTTAISPAMFETYEMGHIDRAATEVQRQGKLYLHHSCGLIRDLLGLYRRTRMDVVDAVNPPPMGNTPIDVALEQLGPDIAIIAAMPQLRIDPFDHDEVRRSLDESFAQAGDGRNLVLGMAGEQNRTIADMEFLVAECRKRRQGRSRRS